MAVTITANELAGAIKLDVLDSVDIAESERLLSVSTELVQKQAPGAPGSIQNEAVIRIAGYLLDQPTAPRGGRFSNSFEHSGAASLLRPWIKRGGRICG